MTSEANAKKLSLFLGAGVLLAFIGITTFVYPLIWHIGTAVPLGWLLIIAATLQTFGFIVGMRGLPHAVLQLLSAVVALVVGVLLIRDPEQARKTIILLVVIFLLVHGVSRIVFGIIIRPFPSGEWVMASGVLGVLLSLVLLGCLPAPATWLVALLVGSQFIAEGVSIAFLAKGSR